MYNSDSDNNNTPTNKNDNNENEDNGEFIEEINNGEIINQFENINNGELNNSNNTKLRRSGSHYDKYSDFNNNFNKNNNISNRNDDISFNSYDDVNLSTNLTTNYKSTYNKKSTSEKVASSKSEYKSNFDESGNWVPKWVWDSTTSNKAESKSSIESAAGASRDILSSNVSNSINYPVNNSIGSSGINIVNNVVAPNPVASNPVTIVSVQSSPQFIPVPIYESYSSSQQGLFSDYRDYPSNINNSQNSNSYRNNASAPDSRNILEPGQKDAGDYTPPVVSNNNSIAPYSPLSFIHRFGRNVVLGYLLYYFFKFLFSSNNLRHSYLLRLIYYNSYLRLGISSILVDWIFEIFYSNN